MTGVLRWPILTWLAIVLASGTCLGQSIRLGVITSRTGPASTTGSQQAATAERFQQRLWIQGGLYGIPVEILIRDDGSDPLRAKAAIADLADEEGVLAIVCCSSPIVTREITGALADRRITGLGLAGSPGPEQGLRWHFTLAPSLRAQLEAIVRDAAAMGLRSLGVMTLDNAFGAQVVEGLASLLPAQGLTLAGEARYRPDASVLTPEALWVASHEPDGVVVWGLPRDVVLATAGLRQRGYKGPLYGPPGILDPLSGGVDLYALEAMRFPIEPLQARGSLQGHPSEAAVETFAEQQLGWFGRDGLIPGTAVAHDSLQLLLAGLEQVLAYGLLSEDLPQARLALRDALVGLGPVPGAAGVYDLTEESPFGALASGLIVLEAARGRLVLRR